MSEKINVNLSVEGLSEFIEQIGVVKKKALELEEEIQELNDLKDGIKISASYQD